MEQDRSLEEQVITLLERVDQYSKEAKQGSHEAAMSLLYQFVSRGPDHGPEIKMTHELLQTLLPHKKFALEIARMLCVKANEVIGGSAGSLLTWKNTDLRFFFQNLGAGIQGLLHPQNLDNLAIPLSYLALANDRADRMIDWAEKQLA